MNSEIESAAVMEQGGEWEDEAMWVEPLAIAMPAVGGVVDKTGTLGFGESVSEKVKDHTKTQSEWVNDKMQEFGLYLGASYEGFEDRVMKLLRDIEAASGSSVWRDCEQQSNLAVSPRVSRELHNLITNVYYAGGSSKRNTANSRRALMLSK